MLLREIGSEVVRATACRKGGLETIVYLFADGKPTDEAETVIAGFIEPIALTGTIGGTFSGLTESEAGQFIGG